MPMEERQVSQMPALATRLDGSSASKDIWSDVEPRSQLVHLESCLLKVPGRQHRKREFRGKKDPGRST